MFGFYTRALANYPLPTQAVTTGMLFGTGDLIAHFFIEQKPSMRLSPFLDSSLSSWDKTRTARMALFGAAFAGPVLHHWYRFLDRTIRLSTPVRSLLGRVAVDQLFFAPCFIASFFIGQGLLAGASPQVIRERLQKGYPGALKSNYIVWPAVQCFNFWLVPLQHRLMVVNTFALGWNTYLSHVNQTSREAVQA
ncbi:integral membrane protein mpv17 pmp22 family [Gamsiella multidivaricata]|uniref:integral membrane protein mpv17 pmp22 family n=1 Tax=Gamsiella multidivaricata TaxID=101098 RepID=UPI00222065DC|nr:integral membrane protein mpv17 pmp22 family [Gamsiella multidivaricata]KAI7815895.1 integral membrane protein mpv17 pmp22 family [Gamsiella multidivaricata]